MILGCLLILLLIANGLWISRIRRALQTLSQVPLLRIQPQAADPEHPKLKIVIPARNEEKNLPCCLQSIESQFTSNTSCLVINDRSTDQTEATLVENKYIAITGLSHPQKSYLNLVGDPSEGWTGKNNALHAASSYFAQTEWLLFTDADTIHFPGGIQTALKYAIHNEIDLLTLTPKCLTSTPIERLIQPTAMGLMGLWYPINRTNRPDCPDHFANGQFLLIRNTLYQKLGGHAAVRNCFLEDFALMKKSKELKAKVFCARGQELYGTRMYRSLRELWRGWRRIYLHGSEQNPWILFKQALELGVTSVLPVAGIIIFLNLPASSNSPLHFLGLLLAAAWLILTGATALGIYQTLQAPRRYALLHPIAALIVVGILCDAIRISLFKQKTQWRG